ncbi:hypothetical protein GCM10020221_24880 [Streptomyces thioluteus]|uniref:Uncharacterized protein n=1 Tax=Streptomyces thioluteus TaxID=66431 RepID=A0ABN3WWU9_STRTU
MVNGVLERSSRRETRSAPPTDDRNEETAMRTSARFAALAAVTAIGFGAIATRHRPEAGAQAARSTTSVCTTGPGAR